MVEWPLLLGFLKKIQVKELQLLGNLYNVIEKIINSLIIKYHIVKNIKCLKDLEVFKKVNQEIHMVDQEKNNVLQKSGARKRRQARLCAICGSR